MRLYSIWNYYITYYKIGKHSKVKHGGYVCQNKAKCYSLEMRTFHSRCIMYFP